MQGADWYDPVGWGWARLVTVRRGEDWQGKADMVSRGLIWAGMVRLGGARIGMVTLIKGVAGDLC